MMVNVLKLLEIFTISNMFEVLPMRLRNFWLDLAAAQDARCSARSLCERGPVYASANRSARVATAALSVTSRHDDHDLSPPKTLRPRATSGLAVGESIA